MWFPGMFLILILVGAIPGCYQSPDQLETVTAPDSSCPLIGEWHAFTETAGYKAEGWFTFNDDGTMEYRYKYTDSDSESEERFSGNYWVYDEDRVDIRYTYDEINGMDVLYYECATFDVNEYLMEFITSGIYTTYGLAYSNQESWYAEYEAD